jgi:broad specificity phosphatase PhoE
MKRLLNNPLKTMFKPHNQHGSIMSNSNILLMRHAESIFNKQINQLDNHKSNLSMSEYKRNKSDIRFSKELLDCDITKKGFEECAEVGKHLRNVEIEYVIVSPMKRALMTCENVLSHSHKSNTKVIVYPFLFEKIEDSCDILPDVSKNMRDYPHYDWTLMKNINNNHIYQLNYCDIVPQNHPHVHTPQCYYKNAMMKYKNCSDLEQDEVLGAMRMLGEEEKYIESSLKTFERLALFKDFMDKFVVNNQEEIKNKKILVVGHSIIFKHLTSKYIDEETLEPDEKVVLKNCQTAELSFI